MIDNVLICVLICSFTFSDGGASRASRKENRDLWLNDSGDNVCLTKECVIAAATIIKHLDLRADPCEDFYQFVCGGFAETPLAVHGTWTVDDLLENSMKEQLRKLLQKPKADFDVSLYKMKDYFDSCTNVARVKELGVEPLLQLLDIYGGWPTVVGFSWNPNSFNWLNFTSRIIHDGLIFMHQGITPLVFVLVRNLGQFRTDLQYIPGIKVGSFESLQYNAFESLQYNASTVKDNPMYQLSVELAVLLGANRKTAKKEMKEVFRLHQKIAEMINDEMMTDDNNCHNPNQFTDEPSRVIPTTTIESLYSLTDKIDWLPLMQHALSPVLKMTSDCICIGEAQIIQRVVNLIDETPSRIVANFMFSQLAITYANYIGDERWLKIESNIRKWKSLFRRRFNWLQCLGNLNTYLNHQLVSVYVRNYFKPDTTDLFISP